MNPLGLITGTSGPNLDTGSNCFGYAIVIEFLGDDIPRPRMICIDSNVEITICFTCIWARWERGWPTIELNEIDFCIDAEHKVKQKE